MKNDGDKFSLKWTQTIDSSALYSYTEPFSIEIMAGGKTWSLIKSSKPGQSKTSSRGEFKKHGRELQTFTLIKYIG